MSYPEHEKLKAIQPQSQKLGEFLDEFLSERGWVICEDLSDSSRYENYQPVLISVEEILADFFEIDRRKIEDEKLAMLEECRKLND